MIENYLFHLPAIFFDINDFMELSRIFSQSFGLEIKDFTIVFVSVQNVIENELCEQNILELIFEPRFGLR